MPPSGGVRAVAMEITDQVRRNIMPQPHPSSDVGMKKHSLASSEHRILTDIEVAERLGVSRFTVRSWRLKGVGPRFLKMGRAVRYRSQDVDEYERQALVETQASHDHSPM
jgi:excisionase family DNA binding protein